MTRLRLCLIAYAILWEYAFTGGPFKKESVMWEARFKLLGIHFLIAGVVALAMAVFA